MRYSMNMELLPLQAILLSLGTFLSTLFGGLFSIKNNGFLSAPFSVTFTSFAMSDNDIKQERNSAQDFVPLKYLYYSFIGYCQDCKVSIISGNPNPLLQLY